MEFFKAVFIHLIVPAAGFLWFLKIRNDMREREIERPPVISLFIVFATYGGLVLVILTTFFWYWSGMASLGLAYLIFLAPVITLITAWQLYSERNLSGFHRATFIASASYTGILAILAGSIVVWVQYFAKN